MQESLTFIFSSCDLYLSFSSCALVRLAERTCLSMESAVLLLIRTRWPEGVEKTWSALTPCTRWKRWTVSPARGKPSHR